MFSVSLVGGPINIFNVLAVSCGSWVFALYSLGMSFLRILASACAERTGAAASVPLQLALMLAAASILFIPRFVPYGFMQASSELPFLPVIPSEFDLQWSSDVVLDCVSTSALMSLVYEIAASPLRYAYLEML